MAITRVIRFRFRRGTAAEWTAANPVLDEGEPGLETDTGNLKFGDGATAWDALDYFSAQVDFASITGAPEGNAALAAALGAKAPTLSPVFSGIPQAGTAARGTNTGQLATTAFVQDAVAPQQVLVGADTTLSLANAGAKHVFIAPGVSLTIPPGTDIAIPDGTIMLVLNLSGGNVTIARGAGVAMYDPGLSNVDVVLPFGAWAWLTKNSVNQWGIWRS